MKHWLLFVVVLTGCPASGSCPTPGAVQPAAGSFHGRIVGDANALDFSGIGPFEGCAEVTEGHQCVNSHTPHAAIELGFTTSYTTYAEGAVLHVGTDFSISVTGLVNGEGPPVSLTVPTDRGDITLTLGAPGSPRTATLNNVVCPAPADGGDATYIIFNNVVVNLP